MKQLHDDSVFFILLRLNYRLFLVYKVILEDVGLFSSLYCFLRSLVRTSSKADDYEKEKAVVSYRSKGSIFPYSNS